MLATDLGVVTKEVEEAIAWADLVILESNHDLTMLKNGSYPIYLKIELSAIRDIYPMCRQEIYWPESRKNLI